MRMKDAEELQPIGLDPVEGFKLLVRVHHEANGTLGLVPNRDHFLNPVVSAGQQAACFQGYVPVNMIQHLLPLASVEEQLSRHDH